MEKRSALWQGAAYQDKLLQSYRSINVTLQSALLILGAGFTIGTIAFSSSVQGWLIYSLLIAVSGLGVYLLITLNKLITSRSSDVNYFHSQIIEQEADLPPGEQVFTAFIVYQKSGQRDAKAEQLSLADAFSRGRLIEKGKGHTRKILERNLFWGLLLLWLSFHVVALVSLVYN